MAILAGDSLLTLAFQVLAQLMRRTTRKTRLIAELAVASGTVGGMIGGQVADLEGEGKPPGAELLETIHRAKTGALLRASLRMGAHVAGASDTQYAALSCYGEHVGLAFQIVDDILDVEESSEALGKTAGKDAAQHKITFPAVYGLETSRRMAQEECERAHAVLAPFGDRAQPLARTGRPDRSPQIMKTRLDRLMVDRGLAESREKAQALIMAGEVRVDGQKAAKPGHAVEDDCTVEVLSRPPYVSRGGFKLAGALRHFATRRDRQSLPGYRLVHRRLHRCPAAGRSGARACRGLRRRTTRLEAAHGPASGGARRHQRALAHLRRHRRTGGLPVLRCQLHFRDA